MSDGDEEGIITRIADIPDTIVDAANEARCMDCDSDVHVVPLGDQLYAATVSHDGTCPYYNRIRRDRDEEKD